MASTIQDSIYGRLCSVEIKKLRRMPYAQAKVIIGEDETVLISYTTPVIIIRDNVMKVTGLYSMTIRKHVSAFMSEYYPALGFAVAKKCVEDDACYDLDKNQFVYLEDFQG